MPNLEGMISCLSAIVAFLVALAFSVALIIGGGSFWWLTSVIVAPAIILVALHLIDPKL